MSSGARIRRVRDEFFEACHVDGVEPEEYQRPVLVPPSGEEHVSSPNNNA